MLGELLFVGALFLLSKNETGSKVVNKFLRDAESGKLQERVQRAQETKERMQRQREADEAYREEREIRKLEREIEKAERDYQREMKKFR